MESAWSGNEVIGWVSEPLFLVASPGALARRWAQIAWKVTP
jgi:hypothetical protein